MRLPPVLLLLSVLSACALFGGGRKYVVFFQERSAQLDRQAQSVVSGAAARANTNPASSVKVLGYTDSAGSPAADVALSQQRAQAVADALVTDGVAANRLVREGRGQTGENPGVASRRVEIIIDP
jgi:outer membrane protein OmpA-like peptidoglycan-associated protein